jgi:hypothetical protein
MPTLEHNVIVEMFRENPELAPHFLVTLLHVDMPVHASVEVVESSLDQLIPAEFRADLVLELRDANGTLVLAIVIEVQRDEPASARTGPGSRRARRAGARPPRRRAQGGRPCYARLALDFLRTLTRY